MYAYYICVHTHRGALFISLSSLPKPKVYTIVFIICNFMIRKGFSFSLLCLSMIWQLKSSRPSKQQVGFFFPVNQYYRENQRTLKELGHHLCIYLKKNWLNFSKSLFPVHFNPLYPQPSLFLFALESTFWCFSSLSNHYF